MNEQRNNKEELYNAPWWVVIAGFGVYLALISTNTIKDRVLNTFQRITGLSRVMNYFAQRRKRR